MLSDSHVHQGTVSAKRVVAVLGMHRSGTSALTRGLQTLGVSLGDRLMAPAPNNNETGFWEDVDIQALNDELLGCLGYRWDAVGPIPREALEDPRLDGLRGRALPVVSGKLHGISIFGVKDPRVSRLLPFWNGVFDALNVAVSFVICVRHPLSVKESLVARDQMDPIKSLYLWLDHLTAALRDSAGRARVVVDYDNLVDTPVAELKRISDRLDLPFDEHSSGLLEFATEFLSQGLRHTRFDMGSLRRDPNVPPEVLELFAAVRECARDNLPVDHGQLLVSVDQGGLRMDSLAPAFQCLNRTEADLADTRKSLLAIDRARAQADRVVAELGEEVSRRDQLVAHLQTELRVRAEHVAHLEGEVGKRDQELVRLAAELQVSARQLAVLSERDEQLAKEKLLLSAANRKVEFLGQQVRLLQNRLSAVIEQTARNHDRAFRLRGAIGEVQDVLARREASVRPLEERAHELARILALPEHRAVDKIASWISRYPRLRSFLRALIGR